MNWIITNYAISKHEWCSQSRTLKFVALKAIRKKAHTHKKLSYACILRNLEIWKNSKVNSNKFEGEIDEKVNKHKRKFTKLEEAGSLER